MIRELEQMNIQPRFRGFICTNAHPEGCTQQVKKQIEYFQAKPKPRIHWAKESFSDWII
jgi:trans-2-enoyl-CoA reductase